MTINNCMICLDPLDDKIIDQHYHLKCVKRFFENKTISLEFEYSRTEILIDWTPKILKRMSISGAQPKISLKVQNKKLIPTDVEGAIILKPTPEGYPFVAELEHLCMILAKKCGFIVPPVALINLANGEWAYIIKRFDRNIRGKKILHQEDMTQIMDIPRDKDGNYKYDNSYERVIAEAVLACGNKRKVALELIKRIAFSYLIGDADYHLKNISVVKPIDAQGHYYHDLSPVYDKVSTNLFPGDNQFMALCFTELENSEAIYSESFQNYGFYTLQDFIEMGTRFELPEKTIKNNITKLITSILKNDSLIKRSPLPSEYQQRFIELIKDRIKALQKKRRANSMSAPL